MVAVIANQQNLNYDLIPLQTVSFCSNGMNLPVGTIPIADGVLIIDEVKVSCSTIIANVWYCCV